MPRKPARSADEKVGPDAQDVKTVRDKAVDFLRTRQEKGGGFSTKSFGPGVTAQYGGTLLWLATLSILCQDY